MMVVKSSFRTIKHLLKHKKADSVYSVCPSERNRIMAEHTLDRVFAEADQYFAAHDLAGASLYLENQAIKFRSEKNIGSELTILNELIGLYRKMFKSEDAARCMKRAEEIIEELELQDHVAAATTYLNYATACRAYRKFEEAKEYFEKVRPIYEKELQQNDYQMASYYNNVALLMLDMKDYEQGEQYLYKALESLKGLPKSSGEIATTHMTLAHLYKALDPEGSIDNERSLKEIETVMDILENWTEGESSYYAFVCDSCGKALKSLGKTEQGEKLCAVAEKFYSAHQ